MSQIDDFDRGLKNRREVLGEEWVARSLGGATSFNADYQSLATRFAWNEIWSRPGLDFTTRRLLVMTQCAALSRWEEFELHFKSAIKTDIPLETLKETLLMLGVYSGIPCANTAFKLAGDMLREAGLTPEAQPMTAQARAAMHYTFSEPQLFVNVQGQGSPVVLSHALGVDLHMWDKLAASLAPKHKVLRYDHRGHGRSAVPAGPYVMKDLVDDAARVIREWGQGPVVFVGLSMGGMVGQGLALEYPELLKGLVLANTTSQYPPAGAAVFAQRIANVEANGLESIVDGVMERYFNAAYRANHSDDVKKARRTVLRNDPAGYVSCCHAVKDIAFLDKLSRIKVPTLVIAGADDLGTPPVMAEATAAGIPGAELALIENASHLSAVEQPEKFGQLIGRFLDRVA